MASANCTVVGQKYDYASYGTTAAAYAGFSYSDWYPYALKFTTPEFSGKAQSLTFSLSMLWGKRNGADSTAVSLRYALCRSDANFDSYRDTTAEVTDANQIITGTVAITGLAVSYAVKTVTISTANLAANTTYYLILWGDSTGGYGQDYCTLNSAANHSVSLTYANTYQLSISRDTGTSVSVYCNGSALSNGATITYGDVLTVNINAVTGYRLTGQSHSNGASVTVIGDVSVWATAAVLSYLLSISQGEGTVATVKRTSSPKQGASTGVLTSGATIYHSDVLEITITAKGGYKLSSATVNGSAFASGNSHTVTGAVNVAALALLYAYLIGSGASQKKYVAQIKKNGQVKTYVGFIKQGGSWHPCGQ